MIRHKGGGKEREGIKRKIKGGKERLEKGKEIGSEKAGVAVVMQRAKKGRSGPTQPVIHSEIRWRGAREVLRGLAKVEENPSRWAGDTSTRTLAPPLEKIEKFSTRSRTTLRDAR